MTQGTLKIALFGATGMIGSRIAAEAARRGHQVTALSRNPAASGANVQAKAADLFDPASIAAALAGQDVVASAYQAVEIGYGVNGRCERCVRDIVFMILGRRE
ncbi:NAD(P)-dependent oxidoreductase, partial [Burkholderia pseudomallei]|uniref:NAD(P)-dependent oxidoreductase n=1 Tax=Burkholderia pseudomallei TaxID=28450 RepID=UPI002180CB28